MNDRTLRSSLVAIRAHAPRSWIALAGACAAAAIVAVGVAELNRRPVPQAAAAVNDRTTEEFRPTDAQWASLTIKPVELATFRSQETTDGKIAINEDRATPVFSPYSGRVTRIIANPGDRVDQGAPLFAIEATENVQALNDLITAIGQVNKLRAQFHLAQTAERRQHELYQAKAVAHKDWQQSQSDLVGAQNDLTSAEIALAAARNKLHILGKSERDIGQAESSMSINPETVVTSPIAGTVLLRKVGLGQYLSVGASDPVYSIGDLSTVWLMAAVKETDTSKIRLGAPVEVQVLAYPGRTYRARVTYVAPSVDPQTRRLAVRAEVENADGSLKPEMFASFVIVTGGEAAAPSVPVDAVIYEGDTARVWVTMDDRRIVSRTIHTGVTSDGKVQVVSGLEPGERIVAKGSLFIDRAAKATN